MSAARKDSTKWPDVLKHVGPTSVRPYKAQETILFQGEVPPAALFVTSGFVSAYTINNNGNEQIIGYYAAGDIIPVEWLFGKSPVSLYYYQAFTDCSVVAMARDELRAQIDKNQALANELLERFVSSFVAATVHIHALEHSYANEKLIKLFHYLILRFGEPQADMPGWYSIPFALTHNQIASMIGLTRETVAIETLKLKKKGALQYKSRNYTINLPQLLAGVGSEEFDDLKL